MSYHQLQAQIRSEYQLVKRELIKRDGFKPQDAYKRFVTATFPRTGQVDGFADELRRLISAVTNIPEEARDALVLNQFLSGLPEDAAEKIILSCEREGVLELETVLDKARIMLSRQSVPVTAAITTANPSPRKRTPTSGVKGGSSEESLKNVRCYNCNEYGHLSKNCPRPKKAKNGTTGASSSH